jgi:hypothetical protein
MYDLHSKMATFYEHWVRLSNDQRQELAQFRDTNLTRLNTGLDRIGEEDNRVYAHPVDHCDQGSYPMHTMTQHPDNDYDIDVAIIFRAGDLPADPCDARRHIARAMRASGGGFKTPPEARTNAVTMRYADGRHVDFAVYHQVQDGWGGVTLEHAGPEWKPRNPTDIVDWFCDLVRDRSPQPGLGASVRQGQLRRVVCLLKVFAKSRPGWRLPGGLIISALVAECYRGDPQRDDQALHATVAAIYQRLLLSTAVADPIFPNQQLTDKEKHQREVERFCVRLGEALEHLEILNDVTCTRSQALSAWHWFYAHDFWLEEPDTEEKAISAVHISRSNVREAQPFG